MTNSSKRLLYAGPGPGLHSLRFWPNSGNTTKIHLIHIYIYIYIYIYILHLHTVHCDLWCLKFIIHRCYRLSIDSIQTNLSSRFSTTIYATNNMRKVNLHLHTKKAKKPSIIIIYTFIYLNTQNMNNEKAKMEKLPKASY
jgi:hypothetical protein